jgi:(R,R)-butanediol dehydrogenase/meso-butanediol dehydrogenase/diacetyl reductase
MKALVLHAAGDARIEDRPEPTAPGPDEVTIRIVRAGLCGTDVSEFAAGPIMTPLTSRHPASGVLGPVVLGHEFIGVVDTAGSAVDRFAVGDRVAAGAGVWCGSCQWCRRGQTNLCERYWTFGLSADGGLTERITVPARMLYPVAAHVSDNNAALAQPLAVGLHAVTRSRLQTGDVLVVNGAGAIGSFIIAGAVAAGATVLAVDIDDSRLAIASKLGATHTIHAGEYDVEEVVRELTGGQLADVTIEASGVLDGMSRVQALTRRGGTLLLVGLPKKQVTFNAVDLILREIDVATTVAHVCDENLPAALDLLAGRDDLADLLVEKVVPLGEILENALTPLAQGTTRGKLLIDPTPVAP